MADTNSELKTRLQLLKEIEDRNNRINSAMKNSALNQELLNRYLENQKKKNKELIAELKDINKLRLQGLSQSETSLSSLGSMYDNIERLERERIKSTLKGGDLTKKQMMAFNEMASLNQRIAQLGRDDIAQRAELLDQYDDQKSLLGQLNGEGEQTLANLTQQNKLARTHSQLSKKQKEFLQKQKDVYEGIKDTIGGILETASLLTSTVGGVLGSALIGASVAGGKLLSTQRELGGQLLDNTNISTTLFGTIFPNAVETTKSLSKEFGGLNDVSLQTQFRTNILAKNLGISAGESAKLTGSFARLNDGSAETAENLMVSTKELAMQNGLVPADIMADVAGSAEAFALFGKDGGTNIAEAAIAAGKLGVSMSQLSAVTDNLLDFESSINAELELGAMLGRNINLDRARALAYEGDIGGAVRETLSSLGGIEEFNKMDYFQKKQTAALLGVSVEEFQKMATNADKLNKDGSIQLSQYDRMKETLMGVGEQGLSLLNTLGSAAIAAGQMGFNLGGIGDTMKGIVGGVGQKFKSLLGMGGGDMVKSKSGKLFHKDSPQGKMIRTKGGTKVLDGAKSKVPQTSVNDKLNKTAGSKGPKASSLLKGAAAILILSAALFVAAKAFQEFGSVTWPAVTMGLVGLAGLAGIAYILGKAKGEMIKGAVAVAILGAALIPFAFSMNLIAGLDIGSVMAAAAGLVVFSAAIFGLGLLMSSGVGAVVFGAGLLALAGLGASMVILGAGLLVAAAGFQAIGGSMGSVVSLIAQVKDVLGGMFQYIAPIAALSLALIGLAGSLTLVGLAGITALPGLMAVAAVGTIAMGVGSLLGFGGDEGEGGGESSLIEEIKGLRADLNGGKVGVYMDGQKVTAAISKVVGKVGSNSYAI